MDLQDFDWIVNTAQRPMGWHDFNVAVDSLTSKQA